MDDAALMRGFEGVRDLLRNRQHLIEGKRSVGNALGERRAFDQLQHQRPDAVGFFQAVDRPNVRMIQRGEDLRFPLKAREGIRIIGKGIGKDLDRDVTLQFRIPRAIDFPPAARPKGGEDFVRAETRRTAGLYAPGGSETGITPRRRSVDPPQSRSMSCHVPWTIPSSGFGRFPANASHI